MKSKTFKIHVLKYLNLILPVCTMISMASSLQKTEVKLDLLTDNNMLLIVQKRTRDGICDTIQQYAKVN